MSTTYVSRSLPNKVIQNLIEHGANVRDGDIPIVDVVEKEAIAAFIDFLRAKEEDIDPVLIPAFGLPASAVSIIVQMEVLQLLSAYQPLLAAAFAPVTPLPPIAPLAAVPPGMAFNTPMKRLQCSLLFNRSKTQTGVTDWWV